MPTLPESEATWTAAALYADIGVVLGVPVVNLIWRRLAFVPGRTGMGVDGRATALCWRHGRRGGGDAGPYAAAGLAGFAQCAAALWLGIGEETAIWVNCRIDDQNC